VSLDLQSILDAVTSHAAASGFFERVNTHEPKSSPGTGLTAAVWVQRIGPADSGLASTSARVELVLRIYQNMLMEPQDAIDPTIVAALDALITAYTSHFTLGGLVRHLDLLGKGGSTLSAQAGYLNIDGKMHRVIDLTIPMILNDVWEQVA
jgi:hypothetical protein